MIVNFTYEQENISIDCFDDIIGNKLKRGKTFYEHGFLKHIRDNIEKGLILDVGANIGNHTIYFAKYCASEVIAIEPLNENVEKIYSNIKLNNLKNVTVIPGALSEKSGKFNPVYKKRNMGNVNMVRDNKGIINAVTYEDLHLNEDDIKFIKIDCEDMSFEVLKTFVPLLSRKNIPVSVELDNNNVKKKAEYVLNPLGYNVVGKFNATPTYIFKKQ